MNSHLNHIYLYVSDIKKSYVFYKEFLEILGYTEESNDENSCCFSKDGFSIWLEQTIIEYIGCGYHRKRTGLNHLAFFVDSKEDVDEFNKQFLVSNYIPSLYGTPKIFPEYSAKYYAVYFEDPDKIKIEVCNY